MLRKGKGLTLVEIIVALAVFAIVVASLLPAFIFVARLNVVSKAGIDVTAIAQQESEKFYQYSRNYTFTNTLGLSEVTSTYTIATGGAGEKILTRTASGANIKVTLWNNTPNTGMVKIRVEVSLVNNPQNAHPEQIDSILLFKLV